ncbi:MAG TPA: matrixin family metalloprotease, partial [Bellilinea sp.]|nr:matrixin family metalloprotease [Bellilinea sp.]
MQRLPVLSFLIAALVSLGATTGVQAFTLMRDVWPSTSTTYAMDSSFTNQGAAWVSRANEAAQHWTSLTAFDFIFNSGSANRLRTGTLSCNNPVTLANMAPVEDALGLYRTSFVITVNTGCSNIQWYTGTGTPPMGTYDLRTVLRHEFGHAVGLDHVQGAPTQLMYPSTLQQEVKQIAADDQNGVAFLYNPNSGIRLTSAASYWTGATYDNNYTPVGYKGANWTGGSPFPRALFQTQSWSNQTGASSWFAFFGERITWVFAKAFNRGWQDIYIDGSYVDSILTYDNADILWQVHKTWDMATPGYHVIEIRGLGGGST